MCSMEQKMYLLKKITTIKGVVGEEIIYLLQLILERHSLRFRIEIHVFVVLGPSYPLKVPKMV